MFKGFGVDAKALNDKERLETLYYSLNPFKSDPFVFDWKEMLKTGWDTKDFIAPSSLKFNKSNFEIGSAFGAVNGMNILAGELPDTILSDFLQLQYLFCVNLHVEPLDQITALKFVKNKLTAVESMKIDEQKKLQRLDTIPIFSLLPSRCTSQIWKNYWMILTARMNDCFTFPLPFAAMRKVRRI